MDEKRLEQEYRKIKQQATPDLWSRIEAGLKDHPERITAEASLQKEGQICTPADMDQEAKAPLGLTRSMSRIYKIAAAAAAMLVLVVALPVLNGKKDGKPISEDLKGDMEYAAAAAETVFGDEEAALETAADAGGGAEPMDGYSQEEAVPEEMPEGVTDYRQLQLAAYQPVPVPEDALTVPEDSQYFSEAILKDAELLCGGTVTKVSLEEDVSGRANKVVYEMTLDQVYYAEDYTAGMEQITVKSPIVKTDGDEVYILYQLQPGGTYLLPLVKQEGGWELLYPFAPQIQVTRDGAYLFHSGYVSLVNDTTEVVIGSREGENDYYYDRMVLRNDEDFLSELMSLVEH